MLAGGSISLARTWKQITKFKPASEPARAATPVLDTPVTQDEVDAAAGVQDGDSDFPTSPDQAEETNQT